jgi:hypothetical protein
MDEISKVYSTVLGLNLSVPLRSINLIGTSLRNANINELLSSEDCVKVKPLFKDNPSDPEVIEESCMFAAEKKPATEEGCALTTLVDMPAFVVMLPDPTTEGISKKLMGMLFDVRTIFKRILSLLYCSITSLYDADISLKLDERVLEHPERAHINRASKKVYSFKV